MSVIDPLGRETSYEYDGPGRMSERVLPDPVTGLAGGANSPKSTYTYDLVGNLLSDNDALSQLKTWGYDALNRPSSSTDERGKDTVYTYDLVGNMLTLEDPNHYTTTWEYNGLDLVSEDTNELGGVRRTFYDLAGNLHRENDRIGRTVQYDYDNLYRNTSEKWYQTLLGNLTEVHELTFTYDLLGRREGASDLDFDYDYTFDGLDRLSTETLTISSLGVLPVMLTHAYDRSDNRVQVAATIDGDADFVTDYTYDGINRLTGIIQKPNPQADSNKLVRFGYDLAGQLAAITRHAGDNTASAPAVAVSVYGYDKTGRLTSLDHRAGADPTNFNPADQLANYTWTFDTDNRVDLFTSAVDGVADYDYDPAGQLETAIYTNYGSHQLDEDYDYDDNGNRTQADFGDNNPPVYTTYWEADDNGGSQVSDMSGAGLHADFVSNLPQWTSSDVAPLAGNVSAIVLDGINDYLDAHSPAELQIGTGDFSFSTWVKFDSSHEADMMIASHGNPRDTDGSGFELQFTAGLVTRPLRLYLNNGNGGAQVISYSTQNSLVDDAWHHVGMTIDQDGKLMLYIDGVAVRSATNAKSGNIQASGSFLIGARSSSAGSTLFLDGIVDDIRTYQEALTPSRMSLLAQGSDNGYAVSYNVGANNRLLGDDNYSYEYDAEGNRIRRNLLNGMGYDRYKWDHRNRLVSVDQYAPRENVLFVI